MIFLISQDPNPLTRYISEKHLLWSNEKTFSVLKHKQQPLEICFEGELHASEATSNVLKSKFKAIYNLITFT